ncbi:porin [Chitinasiproducens palmae]|uniref:Outer membrane protein (Porin) n=1 Tax=Chitinasiproducens palmae TaxID=1770053 RepID=A0A1H2PS48_9BURK|nr:porin [Chitinasiproducens palmae]SDV49395.1 Outer membrane protein (porin) [Chitinasiproducens palmae]
MKKSLLAVAALSTFAGAAHAQSSVTLYGIIDAGVNYTSNVRTSATTNGRQFNLTSGVMQGSRWGLRGTEDLGGGLKAIFVLENGFDVAGGGLGQGGRMFGRQAFVGLSSNQYGSVTLGRQYDSVVDFVGPFEAGSQWGGYVSAHPADLDNFNNAFRTNNAIKYTSNNYNGFKFGGLYSLGGVAGDNSRNQVWSLGAGYANGPVGFGVGYLNVRNPNIAFGGGNSSTSTAATSYFSSPVTAGFASAHTLQVIGAGGSYAFGPATLGLTYSNTKFKDLGDTTSGPNPYGYTGSATFNNAEINFKYQLTPALLAGAAYDYTRGPDINGSRAQYHQGSLGLDYFLSKRTDVYIIGVFQKAKGNDSTGQSAVASINGLTASSSDRQAYVRVGVRHKF